MDETGAATDAYSLDAFGRYMDGWTNQTPNPYRFGGAWGSITNTADLLSAEPRRDAVSIILSPLPLESRTLPESAASRSTRISNFLWMRTDLTSPHQLEKERPRRLFPG